MRRRDRQPMAHIGKVVTGEAGMASEVLIDRPINRNQEATVGTWFLHCPGQSPAWSKYALSVVHLRVIEGCQVPNIMVPGATHEFLLLALDPDRGPLSDDPRTWRFLHPINLAEQVELPDDAAAKSLLDRVVREVVDGRLWAEPLLSGQVEPWRSTLRDSAAHLRGEHG